MIITTAAMLLVSVLQTPLVCAPSVPVSSPLAARLGECAKNYETVLKPDKDAADWWAGAPSVIRDREGVFWMAARMRTADGARGLRGYEVRILRGTDGVDFQPVKSIRREDVPIPGFERPALLQDPATGKYKLYLCGPWKEGPWSIIKLDDADTPEEFNPATARPVISPAPKAHERDIPPEEYKDPVIIHAAGAYHCYVIGYLRRNERVYHFSSPDGEVWKPAGGSYYHAVMDLSGWHDFFVRPAAVVPVGLGWLFIYEGSSSEWHDPVYNVLTGLAFTFDLDTIHDITPEAPLFGSTTPGPNFHTWRYSTWLRVDGELWAYAEVACPNDTKEIRRFRFPVD